MFKILAVTSTGLHHQYIGLNFPGFVSSLIGHVYLEKGLTQNPFEAMNKVENHQQQKAFLAVI